MNGKNKSDLRIFEWKILHKILGSERKIQREYVRELEDLIESKSIVVEALRIEWFGHLFRMPVNKVEKKIFKTVSTLNSQDQWGFLIITHTNLILKEIKTKWYRFEIFEIQ